MWSITCPGTAGNRRREDYLHRGTHISQVISCQDCSPDLFLLLLRCSNRSNDLSLKACDQVTEEFLPLHDEWLNISVQLTWATAAWYHAISNLVGLCYSRRRKTEQKPMGDSRLELSTKRSTQLWALAALSNAVFIFWKWLFTMSRVKK